MSLLSMRWLVDRDNNRLGYFISSNFLSRWGWGSPYGDAKMDKISRISDTQRYKERLLFVR